jgi:hypothetical protein
MSKAVQGFSVIVMALALWIPGARAQGTEQAVSQPNVPSATPPLTESDSPIGMQEAGAAGQEPVRTTPYNPPLAGAGDFTPGGSPATRSFLLPAVNFSQQMDTNPFTTAHPGSPLTLSSILGTLTLQRNSGRSQVTLNYMGGGTVANRQAVSNGQTDLNSVIQQLEASETVNWRRWTLLMSNQFGYFPESSFGSLLGSPSSLGSTIGHLLGESLPKPQSFLLPNQSILTGRGARVSNTFLTQGEYHFTGRSSVTFAGAYGFLRFLDSDLVGSSSASFTAGYNHQIDRADTVAVNYRFNALRFGTLNGGIDDHAAQLSYGRRITGRLAFRLAGGPEVERPQASGVANQSQLLWSLESALHYRLNRSALDLSYSHELTGGAGVLAGAQTNQVEVTVTGGLSRIWRGSFGLGYAHNRSVGGARFLSLNQAFNTWYANVQLSRPLVHSTDLFLGYSVQQQGSNIPFCAGLICARSLMRHQITMGFNWHHRPIAIE